MRRVAACVFVLACALQGIAQTGGAQLTGTQGKEVIRLAAAYPLNPTDPALDQQASAVAKLLITPDAPASTCADHLPWLEKKKYKYAHELTVAFSLGSGSYILQHAGTRPSMVYYPALLAGSQAAISTYQVLLSRDSSAKLDKMEDWVAKQQSGQFVAYLEEKCQRPNPALSRPKVPITADEKQRIIQLADLLQQAPLDSALRPEYQELFIAVVQAPDLTVEICGVSTPWESKPEYKYGPDLMAVDLMAMAALVLQNPTTDKDGAAQNRAGLAAVLSGYQAILKQDSGAHSKAMDDLLSKNETGRNEWFRAQYAKCSKK